MSERAPASAVASRFPERYKRLAIIPAFNEASCVGRVIEEVYAFDPALEILVVDDGSTDGTAAVAADHGATVLRLPFNLGIGGAVQTGYRYAHAHGFDVAVQIDSDGQHDPTELSALLAPLLAGDADMVVGSRFAGRGVYRAPFLRRAGIRLFAWTVSRIVGQRVTDTTSGFRATNRRGIALFAFEYAHDYPEAEAIVAMVRSRLRVTEVGVLMRDRLDGRSSITALGSIYYTVKVLLAILIALLRPSIAVSEAA
jgi:glycosyltransferase involved in cell wall biosynthesis